MFACALLQPVAGDHAVGEGEEVLGEDALRAVLLDDGRVEADAGQAFADGAVRNA